MSDTKISALSALLGADVDKAADYFPIVDTSVTTTKKILISELFATNPTFSAGAVIAASQALTGTVANSTISGFLSIAATNFLANTTTCAVANATATTLNIGAAASGGINIGHASGTTTALGNWTIGGTLGVAGASTFGSTGVTNVTNTSSSTDATAYVLTNTSASGRSWQMGTAGSANGASPAIAVGSFYIYDGTAAAARLIFNTIGAAQWIDSANTSAFAFHTFTSNSATAGSITRVAQTAVVTYNTSSDERLKNDFGIATDTSVLRALKIHDFEWKENGIRGIGVFAQEAHKVWADPITVGGDDPKTKPWGAGYSTYVPHLIVGWQNHEARLTALEAAIRH